MTHHFSDAHANIDGPATGGWDRGSNGATRCPDGYDGRAVTEVAAASIVRPGVVTLLGRRRSSYGGGAYVVPGSRRGGWADTVLMRGRYTVSRISAMVSVSGPMSLRANTISLRNSTPMLVAAREGTS